MIGSNPLESYYDIDNITECWNWNKYKSPRGYGRKMYKGKVMFAHRFMYERLVGKIPRGMVLCHKCDNPGCVNPKHLFVGTQKDNVMDAYKKGRMNDLSMYKGVLHSQYKGNK